MSSTRSHYFDDDPLAPSAPKDVELRLRDGTFVVRTDRGVFGYGQVDAGTKALLECVPQPPAEGDLVDLGCGTGAIAVTMARRAPQATVWAVDVNPRARHLCAATAAANGVNNVRVVSPDEFDVNRPIAGLWSNPPIRVGKPVLHDMLRTWLGRLVDGGEAWLVVHKHLGGDSLQRWLGEQGFPTERVASSSGYRILRSVRHDSDPARITSSP